jgi:hypothetical protein
MSPGTWRFCPENQLCRRAVVARLFECGRVRRALEGLVVFDERLLRVPLFTDGIRVVNNACQQAERGSLTQRRFAAVCPAKIGKNITPTAVARLPAALTWP